MKIWYCEEDEAPIPEGETVEIKIRTDFGNENPTIGYKVVCKDHAEKLGYSMDAIGEWHFHADGTEYLVEVL